MKRREFLKFSSAGLAAIAAGGAGGWALFREGSVAFAASSAIDLTMVEVEAEMVDGVPVPMWAFSSSLVADGAPRIPGPVLFANEGETIRLRLRSLIGEGGPHAFAVPGVVETAPLGGDETEVEFVAPKAGTYFYLDPLNAPVNRVMGLHGVLVVLPSPVANRTPYSDPTPNIRRLFDDLGTAPHFPGHPWDPDRNAVWVFGTVDPDRNAEAARGAGAIHPAVFLGGYLPQYFTINGKSGFFAAQHGSGEALLHGDPADAQANVSVHGNAGQPTLIRNLNAGLMWHSPHIHGNHVYELSENGAPRSSLMMLDTWTIAPLARKDLLLPFIQPPDIPVWPPVQELFPLLYPMHDHNEISNTAAGGNYPQGMATHWQIDGPIDPNDAVILVERAEIRLRTGQLLLEGRSSTPNVTLEVHGGGDGPRIGTVRAGGDGRWSFRGRALRALTGRRVTVTLHDPLDPAAVHARRIVPLRVR